MHTHQEIDVSQVMSLEGLTSVHQVQGLSVKQLKLLLQQNCINYKGCVEKEELQLRVRRLWQAKEGGRGKGAQLAQAGDAGEFRPCAGRVVGKHATSMGVEGGSWGVVGGDLGVVGGGLGVVGRGLGVASKIYLCDKSSFG